MNEPKSYNSSEKLTVKEEESLESYEEVLRKGLETFFEVGNALLAIREGRLYRTQFPSFDVYCRERWGIGRTYAWRVIGAAERLRLLSADDQTPRPTSEFQMRPFLKLEPEAFPLAWRTVIAEAKDGRVTSHLIGKLLADRNQGVCGKSARKKRSRRGRLLKRQGAGEVLMLLQQARHRIESGQAEDAISSLERVERLLFGA
jgi:hypothetical protein